MPPPLWDVPLDDGTALVVIRRGEDDVPPPPEPPEPPDPREPPEPPLLDEPEPPEPGAGIVTVVCTEGPLAFVFEHEEPQRPWLPLFEPPEPV